MQPELFITQSGSAPSELSFLHPGFCSQPLSQEDPTLQMLLLIQGNMNMSFTCKEELLSLRSHRN